MKQTNILFALLIGFTSALAQEVTPPMKISEEAAKQLGVPLVNQFTLAVKKLKDCPCYILDGTLDLFSEGAMIEVSNLRGKLRRYTPESYFRTVNALKCGKDPVYRSMHFDYKPVSAENATVSYFEGSCTVTYKIKQSFFGERAKGERIYTDYTIKLITINLIPDANGVLEPKIIGVIVEKTEKNEINANDPS
jgi:hypothetical protein